MRNVISEYGVSVFAIIATTAFFSMVGYFMEPEGVLAELLTVVLGGL